MLRRESSGKCFYIIKQKQLKKSRDEEPGSKNKRLRVLNCTWCISSPSLIRLFLSPEIHNFPQGLGSSSIQRTCRSCVGIVPRAGPGACGEELVVSYRRSSKATDHQPAENPPDGGSVDATGKATMSLRTGGMS